MPKQIVFDNHKSPLAGSAHYFEYLDSKIRSMFIFNELILRYEVLKVEVGYHS